MPRASTRTSLYMSVIMRALLSLFVFSSIELVSYTAISECNGPIELFLQQNFAAGCRLAHDHTPCAHLGQLALEFGNTFSQRGVGALRRNSR